MSYANVGKKFWFVRLFNIESSRLLTCGRAYSRLVTSALGPECNCDRHKRTCCQTNGDRHCWICLSGSGWSSQVETQYFVSHHPMLARMKRLILWSLSSRSLVGLRSETLPALFESFVLSHWKVVRTCCNHLQRSQILTHFGLQHRVVLIVMYANSVVLSTVRYVHQQYGTYSYVSFSLTSIIFCASNLF